MSGAGAPWALLPLPAHYASLLGPPTSQESTLNTHHLQVESLTKEKLIQMLSLRAFIGRVVAWCDTPQLLCYLHLCWKEVLRYNSLLFNCSVLALFSNDLRSNVQGLWTKIGTHKPGTWQSATFPLPSLGSSTNASGIWLGRLTSSRLDR